jgi:hypothetical protein
MADQKITNVHAAVVESQSLCANLECAVVTLAIPFIQGVFSLLQQEWIIPPLASGYDAKVPDLHPPAT